MPRDRCGSFSAILCVMELAAVLLTNSPIGLLAIGATEQGLAEIKILTADDRRAEFICGQRAAEHADRTAEQLAEYFSKKRSRFELTFDLAGTAFQKSVWLELAKLQLGEATSYGELASRIGKPAAARAVGGAVGSNPIPLAIGCHRVLGSGGLLTGYSGGGGLATKRWLLDFEGIEYRR